MTANVKVRDYYTGKERGMQVCVLEHCSVCGAPFHKGDSAFYDPGQNIICCEGCATGVAMKYLTQITIDAEIAMLLKALPLDPD